MFKSIRWSLLGWYTVLLVVALGGFGTVLYHLLHQAKLERVDAQLNGTAQILTANIRRTLGP